MGACLYWRSSSDMDRSTTGPCIGHSADAISPSLAPPEPIVCAAHSERAAAPSLTGQMRPSAASMSRLARLGG